MSSEAPDRQGLESRLARALISAHPTRASTTLERLGVAAAISFLRGLSTEELARIVPFLSPQFATEAIEALPGEQIAEMLDTLAPDIQPRVARLLGTQSEAVLTRLPANTERALRAILRYPPDSAGGLMDSRVLALPFDISAAEALDRVRELSSKTRYNLYIVDRDQVLVGVLNLRELLRAAADTPLADLMVRNPHRLNASASRANIILHPGWREVHSLPVVDDDNRYLGAIRYRTLRALEESLRPRAGDPTADALGEILAAGAGGLVRALMAPSPRTEDR